LDREKIRKLLKSVKDRKVNIDEALDILKGLPYQDLGFAKIDTHRELRKGFSEVVFCKGKTVKQIVEIVVTLKSKTGCVMATKAGRNVYEALKKAIKDTHYFATAGIVLVGKQKRKKGKKTILVTSAGTSDIPIAEEAAVTAEVMGNIVERLYDIGAAGIHRMFDHREKLLKANVVIVVAGMDGVLPSIIGGLVEKPVIAVPTSIGYGASFNGLSALLTMLNSCAPGIATVNIDNGFGAGYLASVINNTG